MTYTLKTYSEGAQTVKAAAEYLATMWLEQHTHLDRLRFLNKLRRIKPVDRRMLVGMAVTTLVAAVNPAQAAWLIEWLEHGEKSRGAN